MSIREDLESLFEEHDEDLHASENEIRVAHEQLDTLQAIRSRIETEKGISRTQAQTLKTISTGLESMESHFSRYPVTSYTQLPSNTNLKVTQEGIGSVMWETIKRIAKAILNAIVKGWNFMANIAKKIYGFFFRTQKAAKAVSDSSKIVKNVYTTVFDSLSEDAQERLTAEVMSHELSTRKRLSSEWNAVLRDIVMSFTSRRGVIGLWSKLPRRLVNDCIVFDRTVMRLTERISQQGVDGLIEGSEKVLANFETWSSDKQVLGELEQATAGTSEAILNQIYEDISTKKTNKTPLSDEPLQVLTEVGQVLSDLINGPEGLSYGQMLQHVSKNANSFGNLEKTYQKLLSSLKEPDSRVNNEALVAMKTMMTAIDQGFKACAIVNQEFNTLIGIINDNNKGLLNIYLKAAKEGGLGEDVMKKLRSLLDGK